MSNDCISIITYVHLTYIPGYKHTFVCTSTSVFIYIWVICYLTFNSVESHTANNKQYPKTNTSTCLRINYSQDVNYRYYALLFIPPPLHRH